MSAPQSVLFDAPGPRAKILYAVIGVIGVLILLGCAAVIIIGLGNPDNNQWAPQKWLPFLDPVTWTAYLLPGLWATLSAAAVSIVLAGVLGLLLGLGRLSSITVVNRICGVLVEFLRAVPVLVMMLFAYYLAIFVLGIYGPSATFFGVVTGLTLYNGSVIAELLRSGVESLPRGQREASLAVGMTHTQTLISVLLPQAVTAMLPSLVSQLIVVVKDTALGYMISYSELLRRAQTFATPNANLIPTLMVVAVMFIIINFSLSLVANRLEKRLRRSRRGPRVVVTADAVNDPTEPVAK